MSSHILPVKKITNTSKRDKKIMPGNIHSLEMLSNDLMVSGDKPNYLTIIVDGKEMAIIKLNSPD